MPETATNDSLRLANVQIDDLLTMGAAAPIELADQAAPGTPDSGKVRLYAKSGRLYLKDDTGTEVALDAATGGAVLESLFEAYSVLAADTDDTPAAVTLSSGQVVGRARGSGGVTALAAKDLLDILSDVWGFSLSADTWYDGTPLVGNADAQAFPSAVTADRLYAIPFFTPQATTWVKIGINVSTADAGKKFKLGIADVAADGDPGTRLLGTAEQVLDATGNIEVSISQALDAGKFFLLVRSDSGVAKFQEQSRSAARTEGASSPSADGATYRYSDVGTYAANGIPSTWPGSTSFGTSNKVLRPLLKTGPTP
ncbi:MAG: hypothetical protein GY778_17935 [bacterium]|nr:hypothetical protein [bacterium]